MIIRELKEAPELLNIFDWFNKILLFLVCYNLILSAYLITECVSIREAIKGLEAQLNTIQIMESQEYMNSLKEGYGLPKVKRPNIKLKEKDRG